MKINPQKMTAWVIVADLCNDGHHRILGRYCWKGNVLSEGFPIKTFKTRKEAREALPLCCYRDIAKVAKVMIRIEQNEWKE